MSEQEPYALEYSGKAEASLKSLDKTVAGRIAAKIRWLAENAGAFRHEALTGQWSGLYRLRVGDYRVIYSLNHEIRLLLVEVIGHRREVYEE